MGNAIHSDARINKVTVSEIPQGFVYKEGTGDTGFVIENEQGDQYVFIPEGYTADGIFIRGFWVSCYEISEGENRRPMSVAGEEPWTNVSYYEAREAAQSVGGDLISRDEYNRICMWLVSSGAASFENVFEEGGELGYYEPIYKLEKTGSNPNWKHNGIYDFFGNGYIWTKEKSEHCSHHVIARGGHSQHRHTLHYPPSSRIWEDPANKCLCLTFRIVLHEPNDEGEED